MLPLLINAKQASSDNLDEEKLNMKQKAENIEESVGSSVTEKNDDDATTLNLHPAEIYLRMEAEAREKKLNRWIKSQQKQIKKKKLSKLQAAIKRKLRGMKPDQEEEFSDDDILDDLDYDNFHVTFDPEKSPKFNC